MGRNRNESISLLLDAKSHAKKNCKGTQIPSKTRPVDCQCREKPSVYFTQLMRMSAGTHFGENFHPSDMQIGSFFHRSNGPLWSKLASRMQQIVGAVLPLAFINLVCGWSVDVALNACNPLAGHFAASLGKSGLYNPTNSQWMKRIDHFFFVVAFRWCICKPFFCLPVNWSDSSFFTLIKHRCHCQFAPLFLSSKF